MKRQTKSGCGCEWFCKYFTWLTTDIVLKTMCQKWIIISANTSGQWNVRVLDPWYIANEVLCWWIKGLPHVLLEVLPVRCLPPAPTCKSPSTVLLHLSKAEIMWQGFIILFRSQASFAQQRPQSSIWHWFLLIYVEHAAFGVHVHRARCPPVLLCLQWQWYGRWWNMGSYQHHELSPGWAFRCYVAQY